MNKKSMVKLVNAYRKADSVDTALEKAGYSDTPYFYIAGELVDAIYYMLDENTDTVEESVTYTTLNDDSLSTDECADVLMNAYEGDDTDLSEPVKHYIMEGASLLGISVEKMIKVILCEWALQQGILAERVSPK